MQLSGYCATAISQRPLFRHTEVAENQTAWTSITQTFKRPILAEHMRINQPTPWQRGS